MRPEYGVADLWISQLRTSAPRGFGLRAFQVRVRRWLASDFEKTPRDNVQPGRARDARALVIPRPHRK
jgi:hypothetical protein